MATPAPRHRYPWFDLVPHAASVASVAVGVLALIGWVFDVDALKSVFPGLTIMKANTATGFILAGVALWGVATGAQRRIMRIVGQVCAGMVLLLGLSTLAEYLSGADFGVDQLLIREITHLPGDIPGRMAISTALSFAAIGAALLLLGRERGRLVVAIHALAVVPIIFGGSALIGYGYDIEDFLREKLNYTPMAIHAAAVFVLLAFGVVNARADYPFRRFATSSNPAGVMVRRLLPAALGFTLLTGWVIQQGYRAGYFGEIFVLALFTAVSIAGLGVLILRNAAILYDASVQRERVEDALRESEEQLNTIIRILPVGLWILDARGKIAYSNIAAQGIWAGVRYVGVERLGEYKGWRVDDGKPVGAHEWAGVRAVEKGETVIEDEIEIECFDGTRKIILDSAVPLRRSDGSIRGAVTLNQDITERKRIEDELQRSAKEIEDLYDHAPCGYHSLDEHGVFTRMNHTELEWLGYGREDVIGKMSFPDLLTPAGLQAFHDNFPRFKQNGYMHDLEYELKRKDGTLLPVLLSATAIYDASGRYVMSRGTVFDLTERKRAEESIRESQARFSTIFNQAPLGIALIDSHTGKIYEVNPRFAEIAGRTIAQMQSIDWMSITHPDDVQEDLDNMALMNAGKIPGFRMEKRYLHLDGSFVWINMTIAPLRGEQNISPRHLCMIEDITERKRAEEQLRAASLYTRSLIEASLDPLVTISVEGKITDVNEAAVKATGVTRETLIGSDFSVYFTEPEKARAGYREVFAKGFVTDYPLALRHVSGKVMDVLYNASVYRNPQGETAGVFAAARDITERKRIEDELQRSAKEIEDLYEHAPCGYHSLDANGVFSRINHTELEWLGYGREEIVGKMSFRDLLTPDGLRTFQDSFPRFKESGYVRDLEFELKRKDGTQLPILLSGTAIYDASGRYVTSRSTLFDMTERKKLEAELERQARKDMLTGLDNRRHFLELADRELARSGRHGEPLSLLMMDLDHFKSVNDSYGHHVGDAVLQKFSEACRHTFREIDFVGRLGGEEFAALLPETRLEQAVEAAERLRLTVENAAVRLEDGSLIHFTLSIGAVGIGPTDTRIETALRRADAALYKAKNSGRNRVCSEDATK